METVANFIFLGSKVTVDGDHNQKIKRRNRGWGLDGWQSEIKIAERNTNDLIYVDDTTLMAESEEELKSFFLWVNEESE